VFYAGVELAIEVAFAGRTRLVCNSRTNLVKHGRFGSFGMDALAQNGGNRVHLPDRVTTIAFLLGTRLVDLN
jgi:hypothetical protein